MAATQAAAAAADAAAAAALAAAQAALDREGIRAAHAAAGAAASRTGDWAGAQRAAGRARDYCGSAAQVADNAVAAAAAAAAAGAWPTVAAHAAKAEAAARPGGGVAGAPPPPPPPPPPVTPGVPLAALAAAVAGSAAAAFDARKYRAAALKFAAAGAELGAGIAARPDWAWLGAPADVALCGGLAGAAGLEWEELDSVLLASPSFRDHLDARPDVRACLAALAAGRFGAALGGLRALTSGPAARLDARLARHGPALYAQARARILCQYARPYASLRLEPAAADLGMSLECVFFFFFFFFFFFSTLCPSRHVLFRTHPSSHSLPLSFSLSFSSSLFNVLTKQQHAGGRAGRPDPGRPHPGTPGRGRPGVAGLPPARAGVGARQGGGIGGGICVGRGGGAAADGPAARRPGGPAGEWAAGWRWEWAR